jgi:hypothetical protein
VPPSGSLAPPYPNAYTCPYVDVASPI